MGHTFQNDVCARGRKWSWEKWGQEAEDELPMLKKLRYLQSVQTELLLNSAPEGLASKMEGVYTYVKS